MESALIILVGVFTTIAGLWAAISIWRWRFEKPRFRISFRGGATSMDWQATQTHKIGIGIEFENTGKTPATEIRAYVVFPENFNVEATGDLTAYKELTPGGRFHKSPCIYCKDDSVVLFHEEVLTLIAELTAPDVKERDKIHALIICKEGSHKTKALEMNIT